MKNAQAIQCGGFGAHNWYDKNRDRCIKIGATAWCEHCHKDMAEGTGWLVNWNSKDDSLYPMDVELTEFYSGKRLIGNECIKQFLTKGQYAIYAEKVGA